MTTHQKSLVATIISLTCIAFVVGAGIVYPTVGHWAIMLFLGFMGFVILCFVATLIGVIIYIMFKDLIFSRG
jgi:hypothetical protein